MLCVAYLKADPKQGAASCLNMYRDQSTVHSGNICRNLSSETSWIQILVLLPINYMTSNKLLDLCTPVPSLPKGNNSIYCMGLVWGLNYKILMKLFAQSPDIWVSAYEVIDTINTIAPPGWVIGFKCRLVEIFLNEIFIIIIIHTYCKIWRWLQKILKEY